MAQSDTTLAGANPSNPERLRERLTDLLGADRWVSASHPLVAPASEQEFATLLQGYPLVVMVIGTGSSFGADFRPPGDCLIVMTSRLTQHFDHSVEDQTVEVSAGLPVMDVRRRLAAVGQVVPALERFEKGSIGGRIANTSSRPTGGQDGWAQSLLGLKVCNPDGEVIQLGGRCIKDVCGYDLRHLYCGSRGGFGVIVEATFRCRSLETWNQLKGDPTPLPTLGRQDPKFRELLDPKHRMRPGL